MRAALSLISSLLPFAFLLLPSPLWFVVALLPLLLGGLDLGRARGGRGRRRRLFARVDVRGGGFGLLGRAGRGRGGSRFRQALAGRGRQRHLFELGRAGGGRLGLVVVQALRGGGGEVDALLGLLVLALEVKLAYVFGHLGRLFEVLLRLVLEEVLHEVNPDGQSAVAARHVRAEVLLVAGVAHPDAGDVSRRVADEPKDRVVVDRAGLAGDGHADRRGRRSRAARSRHAAHHLHHR